MSDETTTLKVEGMSCMHCVKAVQKSVGTLPGVSRVDVDLEKKKVRVEFDEVKVKLDTIKEAIKDAGYEVV